MAVATYLTLQSVILRKTFLDEAQLLHQVNYDPELYEAQLIERAETSTEPAVLISQIVLGVTPATSAKLDSLANFAQSQFDYYANVLRVARPELGPYEALGRGFADTAEFASISENKGDGQFVFDVYTMAFGTGPNGDQITHFMEQLAYFTDTYVGAGIAPDSARLQARGAVLGQIVGEAALQEDGLWDAEVEEHLHYLTEGTAVFGAPIWMSGPIVEPWFSTNVSVPLVGMNANVGTDDPIGTTF